MVSASPGWESEAPQVTSDTANAMTEAAGKLTTMVSDLQSKIEKLPAVGSDTPASPVYSPLPSTLPVPRTTPAPTLRSTASPPLP